jgi:hypothetical protein
LFDTAPLGAHGDEGFSARARFRRVRRSDPTLCTGDAMLLTAADVSPLREPLVLRRDTALLCASGWGRRVGYRRLLGGSMGSTRTSSIGRSRCAFLLVE